MMQSPSHPVFAMLERYVPVFHKITEYSELKGKHKDHRLQV